MKDLTTALPWAHLQLARSRPIASRSNRAYLERRNVARRGAPLEPMIGDPDPLLIRELDLDEIEVGGPLHGAFLRLHEAWIARGVARWLNFLRSDGPHPAMVYGALIHGHLVGAVVGVWAPSPIENFDDLFAGSHGPVSARPVGGAWHLVAVTTDPRPDLRGLGLGRALLGRVLSWAAVQGFELVRTLSPAIGLRELVATWPGGARDAITTAARADGRPALPVLGLHLGGGAVLERVLSRSRADDTASDHVTLRFLYATSSALREQRRDAWRAWCEERRAAIDAGRAEEIRSGIFRVTTERDERLVWPDPSSK